MLVFAEHLSEEVLENVPHRQFVFTIPKRFRLYFRYDRPLLGKLRRAAWETVRDVYLPAGDKRGIENAVTAVTALAQYIGRCPYSLAQITQHIPDKYRNLTSYYSCRSALHPQAST